MELIVILLLELITPRHVLDSLKATFKKRPQNKHLYQLSTMFVLIMYMMGGQGEKYCQFVYVKRVFHWKMDTFSFYGVIEVKHILV